MKIGLIGYGKMGKEIERLAVGRGHTITGRIDYHNTEELAHWNPEQVEVAIEFTTPETAFDNLKTCMDQGIPVVSGTTGWLHQKEQLDEYCKSKNGTYFYASNYSLGVNITFKVNEFLARIMNKFEDFTVSMEETHHTEKKDAPSGTAISLAQGIIQNVERIDQWQLGVSESGSVEIQSRREGQVPGTHTVWYESEQDLITLEHKAKSRTGFALGAVLVAEWIIGKSGILTMNDFIDL